MSNVKRVQGKSGIITYEAEDGLREFKIDPLSNRTILEMEETADAVKKSGDAKRGFKMMTDMCLKSNLRQKEDNEAFSEEDIIDAPTPFLIHCLREITKFNGMGDLFDFQARGVNQNQNLSTPSSVFQAKERLAQKVM